MCRLLGYRGVIGTDVGKGLEPCLAHGECHIDVSWETKAGLRCELRLTTVAHFGDSSTRVAAAREARVQSQPELRREAGTGYRLCLKIKKQNTMTQMSLNQCKHHRGWGKISLHWLKINPRDAVGGNGSLSGR